VSEKGPGDRFLGFSSWSGGDLADEVVFVCVCRVWNAEKGEVRFVEVKGPGDNLSETQKVRNRFTPP